MANTQSQFGFQPFGIASGVHPTLGLRRRTIAFNYASTLFRGDPVASDANGNIIRVSSQTAPLAGIFWGCRYYDPVQKIRLESKYWPGVSLGTATLVVDALIYDDPQMLFLAASLGGSAAVTKAAVMNNIRWAAGAGGSTTSGLSSYVVDDGNITTTPTLPFKIMDLYSTYSPLAVNGADDTTVYNWVVVKMNETDRQPGSTGI